MLLDRRVPGTGHCTRPAHCCRAHLRCAAPAEHAVLRCAVQVKIMKEWDPTGKVGPKTPLPDVVTVLNPKEEEFVTDKQVVGKEEL